MKVMLEKPASEYSGGSNKEWTKGFHAYKCMVGSSVENEYGFLNLEVHPIGVEYREGDSLSVKVDSQYFLDKVGKWSNAVISSNPSLASKADARDVDTDNWKGYEIGIVYMPQKTKESGYNEYGPYIAPSYAISVDEVDTFKVNETKYDEWCKTFGKGKYYVKSEEQSTPPVDDAPPIDDNDSLPF